MDTLLNNIVRISPGTQTIFFLSIMYSHVTAGDAIKYKEAPMGIV